MTRTEKQTTRRLPIGRILLIAFIVMPIIEIAVLIEVGGLFGLWPTLALIILTAMAGTWMLRQQGFAVLSRAQTQLERGSIPLVEVFEGFCLVIAGALLLTPGFVTDAIGGGLLLPPIRAWLYRRLGHLLQASVSYNETGVHGRSPGAQPQPGGGPRPGAPGPVVEGDYRTVEPDEEIKRDDSNMDPPKTGQQRPEKPAKPMPPPRGSWKKDR